LGFKAGFVFAGYTKHKADSSFQAIRFPSFRSGFSWLA